MTTATTASVHTTLDTRAGTVDVLAQNGTTLYVRGGQSRDQDRELADEARELLDAGRGVRVDFRGHYKLSDGGSWQCAQPFVHRRDQGRDKDPTANMVRHVREAIGEALDQWAVTGEGRAALALAAAAHAEKAAIERVATATQLRMIADHLDEEARELRHGGRVSYRRRTYTYNGGSAREQRETIVQRADGSLMKAPPEVPTLYGSTGYGHDPRWELAGDRETD